MSNLLMRATIKTWFTIAGREKVSMLIQKSLDKYLALSRLVNAENTCYYTNAIIRRIFSNRTKDIIKDFVFLKVGIMVYKQNHMYLLTDDKVSYIDLSLTMRFEAKVVLREI